MGTGSGDHWKASQNHCVNVTFCLKQPRTSFLQTLQEEPLSFPTPFKQNPKQSSWIGSPAVTVEIRTTSNKIFRLKIPHIQGGENTVFWMLHGEGVKALTPYAIHIIFLWACICMFPTCFAESEPRFCFFSLLSLTTYTPGRPFLHLVE